MKRLVKDAAKIDESIDANSLSFANITQAIHVMQDEMGIAGATQEEAERTISGSLSALKASWENLLPALVEGGDGFDQCADNLIDSAMKFKNNIAPAVERALEGIGSLIEKSAPVIEQEFPKLAGELLPPLIKAATSMLSKLIKVLPSIIKTVIKEVPNIARELGGSIADAIFSGSNGESGLRDGIAKGAATMLPALVGLVGAYKGYSKLSGLLGRGRDGDGSGGGSGGLDGIIGLFRKLANVKPTVILKAIGNISIIVLGITALTAAFMLIAPKLAKISDVKSFAKVLTLVSVLAVVGSAMSFLAGKVGDIPVSKVALGLANIAIIVTGMGALLFVAAKVFQNGVDFRNMVKVIALLGILGTVGSAITLFAGIVGAIPVPVALTGLANMALVLGGITGIIVAFGKLNEVKGFRTFLQTGGDTLALLFEQIGKIGGSLVGGIGEGISRSLPVIGQNIADFADEIKPAFTAMQGVDMGGAGTFFSSIGGFMADMAKSDLAGFLTGGTDLDALATQLTSFASNSAGFFNTVATLPENGFTNATAMFNAFGSVKDMPKSGGVVQYFTGDTYAGLQSMVAALPGLGTATGKFFTNLGGVTDFNPITGLFNALASVKDLPKAGGFAQFFKGDAYSGLSNMTDLLPGLGTSVKKFFDAVADIDDFSKISKLFDALANVKKLPEDSGFWTKLGDSVTGEETKSQLGLIASDLKNFAADVKPFFEQLDTLNLNKLDGFWESLKKPSELTTGVLSTVSDNIDEIVKKVSDLPKKMGDGIKKAGSSLSDALVSIWKDAVKASAAPVNKVISGANWILKEFGSNKRIASWTPYARGTDGHPGGNALVNDGRGAELVQMPNGKAFIPQGRNVFIPNAPKGMKVLTAERTAQLMGRTSPAFHYAKGTGDIDVWDYVDNAKGLVEAVNKKNVDYSGISGLGLHIGKAMVNLITGAMEPWAKKLYSSMGGMSIGAYNPSKGVEQWRSTVIRALKMEGLYSEANVARTLFQMQTESGGNPRAINLWDSNAKAGIPSKGLMQVIDPTFRAYARPGYNTNIWDPLSNILASIRYAVARYGSLARAYRGVGYANGGIITQPHFGLVGEAGPESIIPLSQSKRRQGIGLWAKTGQLLGLDRRSPEQDTGGSPSSNVENNTYAPQFVLNISGTSDDRATARKVKRWVKEAMDDVFESMERKSYSHREA